MASEFEINGIDNVARNVVRLTLQTPRAKMRALRKMAEPRVTTMRQLTPVDLGNLRSTVGIDGPRFAGGNTEVAWRAGGPSEPYAIVQHEDTSLHHTVGQAKFIESVVMEESRQMLDEVAAELGLALRIR